MSYRILVVVLVVLVVICFLLSLIAGETEIGFMDLFAIMAGDAVGPVADIHRLILQEIRLPRAILGLTVGFTLGLSGAAMQGFLRNPLAEPGLIGVSASGALGAVVAIYTGLSLWFPMALPLIAVATALLAVIILQWLSRGAGVLVLILSGVAISSLAGALTSLVLNLSTNPFASLEIIHWMLGSITDRNMDHVILSLPFMMTGWVMLLTCGGKLEVLSLGEHTAQSMGVNLPRLRWQIILGTGLAVGAATSVSGVIGFLGLVVPHLMRPLVAYRPGRLLLASGLVGAILLLLADIMVRMLPLQVEIKLGVVTALLGAPFFFWLIFKTREGDL
ncbi:MAG: iron ABC transporter permease [Gammaproteobacteria bacterium]|nr:iron ABC transporter permease [Gammaproteobacteria bacterium]